MNSHSYHRGAKPPIALYLSLRRLHREVRLLEGDQTLSQRQRAARLGMFQTSYRRLASTIGSIPQAAWEAAEQGDWRLVERIVFQKVRGDYRLLPSFQRALVELGDSPSGKPKRKSHVRRRKRRSTSILSILRRTLWRIIGYP